MGFGPMKQGLHQIFHLLGHIPIQDSVAAGWA